MGTNNATSQPVDELSTRNAAGDTFAHPEHGGRNNHVAPAASDSEKIRTVLAAIVRISLSDDSLDKQLEQILETIFSIPWLALEAKGAIFLVEEGSEVLVMKAQKKPANSAANHLRESALRPLPLRARGFFGHNSICWLY